MTTDTKPVIQYAEMVGFLKGQRLAGVRVQCKLSADYSTVRAEYERLINVVPEEVVEPELIDDADKPSLPQFTDIKVLEFPTERSVEIQINDEVREIDITWDNDIDSGMSINKEVAVTFERGISRCVNICKLEVFQVEGIYRAYPLSKEGGRVEFLYPHKATKIQRIKGYLTLNSDNWRWVDIDINNSTPEVLTSENIVVSRDFSSSVQGIRSNFPAIGQFTRISNRWILIDHNGAQWISTVQDAMSYQYKVGEMVYLQGELGLPRLATFQIMKTYYSKHLLFASIRCVVGNKTWRRNSMTVVPIVQLINIKRLHTT